MSYLWLTLRWHASYLTTKVHHKIVKKYHICDSVNNSKYDSQSTSIEILERRHLLLPALNSADFTVWHCDKSIIPWGAEYCDFEKNSLSPLNAGSMKFMNTYRWCQGMFRWIIANITLRLRHLSCHQWTFMTRNGEQFRMWEGNEVFQSPQQSPLRMKYLRRQSFNHSDCFVNQPSVLPQDVSYFRPVLGSKYGGLDSAIVSLFQLSNKKCELFYNCSTTQTGTSFII